MSQKLALALSATVGLGVGVGSTFFFKKGSETRPEAHLGKKTYPSSEKLKRVVIVGGVAAGASVAARLRRLSEEVEIIILERGAHVSFANCGLPYYVGKVVKNEEDLTPISPEYFIKEFGIEVRLFSTATAINTADRTVTVECQTSKTTYSLEYSELVLCQGASPFVPPSFTVPFPKGVFSVRTVEDAKNIYQYIESNKPKSALVLGGGLVGVEMAENLQRRFINTTIIEAAPQILPFADADFAGLFQHHLTKNGVKVILSTPVKDIAATEDAKEQLQNSSLDAQKSKACGKLCVMTAAGQLLTADLVIVALGVRPEAQLAHSAGVALGSRGGIAVDPFMGTSLPHLWAAGDVCECKNFITGALQPMPMAGPANRQGRLIATNIAAMYHLPSVGGAKATLQPYRGTQGSVIVGAFGLALAATGPNARALTHAGVDFRVTRVHLPNHVKFIPGYALVSLKVFSGPQGELYGAQAIGTAGIDKRMDMLAAYIQMGATVYDLEDAEVSYSPQYNSAKDVINLAGMVAHNALQGLLRCVEWHTIATEEKFKNAIIIDCRPKQAAVAKPLPLAVSLPSDTLRTVVSDPVQFHRVFGAQHPAPVVVVCDYGKAAYFCARHLDNQAELKGRVYVASGGYLSLEQLCYSDPVLRAWLEAREKAVLASPSALAENSADSAISEPAECTPTPDVPQQTHTELSTETMQSTKELFLKDYGSLYGYDGEIDRLRCQEFPLLLQADALTRDPAARGVVYLDNTAATLYARSQLKEVFDDLAEKVYGNPHSVNPSSTASSQAVSQVREMLLAHFGVSQETHTVIFTSNCTGALKLVGESFPWGAKSEFRYLAENHNSVLGIREYAHARGARVTAINEGDPTTVASEVCAPREVEGAESANGISLFAFPGECNYTGVKYPLHWVNTYHELEETVDDTPRRWLVLLDAAALAPTTALDLSVIQADFVTMSFYKIFGYPTGLGCLIARNEAVGVLQKHYWGGGNVDVTLSGEDYKLLRSDPIERFEDGTINFQNIISLRMGLAFLQSLGMDRVSRHTYALTQYLYTQLAGLTHSNGQPFAKLVGYHHLKDIHRQGSIINCNLMHSDASYIGYSTVDRVCAQNNVHVRSGCHCNPGACVRSLQLSNSEIKENAKAGFKCGGGMDLGKDLKPLGAVRISIGYHNTFEDVEVLLKVLKENFLK